MTSPSRPPATGADDGRIDAALRRQLTPPDPTGLLARVHDAIERSPRTAARRRAGWTSLAAALLLAAAMLALLQRKGHRPPPAPAGSDLVTQWVSAFHTVADGGDGFRAPSCCDAATDLPSHCRAVFAAAVDVARRSDLQPCGTWCGEPTGGAVAMLARCGDDPVCLFVVPQTRAPRIEEERHGDVTVRRRDVGTLAVFEISRLPAARVLPHVFEP